MALKYIEACECQRWHLQVWPKVKPEAMKMIPYKCRSWRHRGECCRWKGAQDFARVTEAVQKRDDWVYVVLTYDKSMFRGNFLKQYRSSYFNWSKLRLRMLREYGKVGYIQTWERHQEGGLHVNILMGNCNIAKECNISVPRWKRNWLTPNAMQCGFGFITYVKCYNGNSRGIAGYLTKLARELTGAGVKNQIPYDAPPHFRRLRASRGLLPKPRKNPEMTGVLVRLPIPDIT